MCAGAEVFFDGDGDGWGDVQAPCGTTAGVVERAGDCNDGDVETHPDAIDDCVGDRSCDGTWVVAVPAACPTIQLVLDASAASGESATVELAGATYVEDLRFGTARVMVEGAGPGLTIIEGTGSGPVATFDNGRTTEQGLRGLTVRGGVCEVISNVCHGGGIRVDRSSPALEDLEITGNLADAPTASYGGGISLSRSSARLIDVEIHGNTSMYYGGGIYHENDTATLERVRITSNVSDTWGGAVASYYSSPRYDNVILAGNQATYGAAMFVQAGAPQLVQLTVIGNTCARGCGVYAISNANVMVHNSTITDNMASDMAGAALIEAGSALTARYSNFFGNGGSPFSGLSSPAGGGGNVSEDPEFIDATGSNPRSWMLRLDASSPLRNAGDPAELDLDATRSDIGAYGGMRSWP
ncbi:MAG: right-handed parallel beta-helix repeat-containing protein [Kofleriaceae bacterium]